MAMMKMEVADRERKLLSNNKGQYSGKPETAGGTRWKMDIKRRQKEMKRANSKRGGVSRHRM
jgi:uncharacterized protein (DUF2249 family)